MGLLPYTLDMNVLDCRQIYNIYEVLDVIVKGAYIRIMCYVLLKSFATLDWIVWYYFSWLNRNIRDRGLIWLNQLENEDIISILTGTFVK